jgi:serine/threonine protein phosphatase PrpC
LWNYASEASVLKELVDFLDMPTPEALSQYLVSWACEKGGHDNITVACARIETDLPQSRTTHDETAQTTDTTSD